MSIYEYDEEKHMRAERKEHYALGFLDGKQEGISKGISQEIDHGIYVLIQMCQKIRITREEIIKMIIENYSLTLEEAENYLNKYWKKKGE